MRTTFRFNRGAFDGPVKVYHPTGFVKADTGNAHWGMQFVWPLRTDYRIAYLSDDYQQTIIGRSKRDYVWIMARDPALPHVAEAALAALRARRRPSTRDARE